MTSSVTDKRTIFIDASVNGRDFAKCSAAKSSHQEFADGLFLVISIMEGVMNTKKTG